jgi:hypothetical protein
MHPPATPAATALAVLALVACTNATPARTASAPPATSAPPTTPAATLTTPAASPAPTPTAPRVTGPRYYPPPPLPPQRGIAVYYVGDNWLGLYREHVDVSPRTISRAVDLMLHRRADDGDYRSVWPRSTRVRGVSIHGTVATVDLTRDALGVRADERTERASLQQLAHTVVTVAPHVTGVRLWVGGRARPTLWGHVDTTGVLTPDDQALGGVWVTYPVLGATVGRTFTVTGESSMFEAGHGWLVWQDGHTLASGVAKANHGAPGRGDWTVHVTLPPGTSGEVLFSTGEISEVEGRNPPPLDTKTFVVA